MKILTTALLVTLCLILGSCKHKYFGMEADVDMAIDNYGQSLAKKTGMQFLLVGNSTNERGIVYCLTMRRYPKETLNEARILGANLVEEFVHMLQKSKEVKDYLKEMKATRPWLPNVFSLEDVGYRVDYWDKDINRPLPPYIAEIMFESGTFSYYEAEPETQKLKLVYKESYEQAIQYRNSLLSKISAKKS